MMPNMRLLCLDKSSSAARPCPCRPVERLEHLYTFVCRQQLWAHYAAAEIEARQRDGWGVQQVPVAALSTAVSETQRMTDESSYIACDVEPFAHQAKAANTTSESAAKRTRHPPAVGAHHEQHLLRCHCRRASLLAPVRPVCPSSPLRGLRACWPPFVTLTVSFSDFNSALKHYYNAYIPGRITRAVPSLRGSALCWREAQACGREWPMPSTVATADNSRALLDAFAAS